MGTPELTTAGDSCGVPLSCTDAGPPERMMALGRAGFSAASALSKGTISEVHARLPHPPRDQLRVLGAEIDDEDFVRVVRHGVG